MRFLSTQSSWVGLMLVLLTSSSFGAEPSWPDDAISVQVQEQPLETFLRDFFAANDMTVLVSDTVSGRISGKFNAAPRKVFSDVVKAYGLLPYFDGAVMHVSMAADVQSRSFEMNSVQLDQVLRALIDQELSDQYQSVLVLRADNSMRVRGAPEFILDVERIVQSVLPDPVVTTPRKVEVVVEQAPNELEFRTFPLQYASASDVTLVQGGREFTIPGVASILRSIVGDGHSPQIRSMQFGPSGPARVPGLRERTPSQAAVLDADITLGPSPDVTALSSGGVATDRAFVARIEAERNLNAVIVRDYADTMPVYEQLIAQLDQEPLLVEIQVTIIDVDRSDLSDLGVDWQYEDNQTQAVFGGGDVGAQNGGLLLNTVLGDSGRFLSRVNALAVTGSAEVVSRPQVLTLSNLEAVLASDQSFFVRVAGNEDVDLFNVTVGTTLRVVPSIVGAKDDPQIRLLVSIEDGSLTPDAVDEIPIIDKSSLSTQAIIYNGESLLLGGLVRNSTTSDTTKVPVLGDVPLLGRVFRRKTDVTTSTERLFLITPQLVHGSGWTGRGVRTTKRVGRQYDVQNSEPQMYLDGFR